MKAEDPTGIDLVLTLADEIRRCRANLAEKVALYAEAEKAVVRAKGEAALVERRLADLIATGACTDKNGCANGHGRSEPQYSGDENVPKMWRIAFALLDNPMLDYDRTAERIWGPGLDRKTAKNRISSNIAALGKMGVAERVGKNTFKIHREKLVEKSGLPIVEAP